MNWPIEIKDLYLILKFFEQWHRTKNRENKICKIIKIYIFVKSQSKIITSWWRHQVYHQKGCKSCRVLLLGFSRIAIFRQRHITNCCFHLVLWLALRRAPPRRHQNESEYESLKFQSDPEHLGNKWNGVEYKKGSKNKINRSEFHVSKNWTFHFSQNRIWSRCPKRRGFMATVIKKSIMSPK